jgi:exodeoxyribonuclease III
MKIISWNVNGIRSVVNKDELPKLLKQKADFYCFQELKAQEADVPKEIFKIKNYQFYFNCGHKKGHSGVGILTNQKPISIQTKIGFKQFDDEGRFLMLEFKNYILINFYIINGGRQKENMAFKLKFYKYFLTKYLPKLKTKNLILIGDFNIAHTEIDLARPKQNQKNTMFTPEERIQITNLLKLNFIDSFRYLHKAGDNYTWWPYFANARARNLGWRIDYCFVQKKLLPKLETSFILPKQTGSDHCPIGITINL